MGNDTNISVMTGRLARKPELQVTKNGKSMCHFTIAVNLYNGVDSSAHYFNWIAWGKTAEYVCGYIDKGDLVIAEGEARQRIWDDKDGNKHYEVEFSASSVKLIRRKVATDVQPVAEKAPVLATSSSNGHGHGDVSAEPVLPLDEKPPEGNYVLDDGYNDDEVPF